MATPQAEIDRQHDEAKRLVAEKNPYATCPTPGQEIPLWKKTHAIQRRLLLHAGDDNIEAEKERLGPFWSTRGHVDVTALQDLVREGYNRKTTTCSSSSSSEATATNGTTTKKKKKKYTASDIKSTTDYWDPIHAAVRNVKIHRPSHDAWGIHKICLVFCDDFIQRVYEMPFYSNKHFESAIQPILECLNLSSHDDDAKQQQHHRVVRCILASLPPGVTIPVHEDSGEWVKYTHRIHVPILVKNPDNIVFTCGHDTEHMERIPTTPGHVFEINNQAKHFVSNCDDDYRVHLILDYLDEDTQLPGGLSQPQRIVLEPGEVLLQTRRSIDRYRDRGQRPTPSFFILGAQKAGTTSLYEYLNQHALIVKPKRYRETHCLDWRWKGSDDDDDDDDNVGKSLTAKQIQQSRDHCLEFYHTPQLQLHPSCQTGDSTPSYLLDSRRVLPRLLQTFDHVAQMKFFVMLREPIARAESHYAMATSSQGTPEQLKTRGSEWRQSTLHDVIQDDFQKMKSCGLIPYWDMERGVVDEAVWKRFVDTQAERDAWNLYLARHVPLNTGSYGLLARGLYAVQLESWLSSKQIQPSQFLVLHLERHFANETLESTMHRVWRHLNVPPITLADTDAKNTRDYTSKLDNSLHGYLQRFFEPHNRRLYKLLTTSGTAGIELDAADGVWQDPWPYSNDSDCSSNNKKQETQESSFKTMNLATRETSVHARQSPAVVVEA